MIIYQLVLQALTFASLFISRTCSSKKLGSKCFIYKPHCPMEIWYPEQWKITNHNVWVMVYDIWRFTSFKTDEWSDIVNYTGPHIFLSYTFQNILKPHINYSTINGLDTETTMQSQSKINLSWRSRQLLYSCILKKKEIFYIFGSNDFTEKAVWS